MTNKTSEPTAETNHPDGQAGNKLWGRLKLPTALRLFLYMLLALVVIGWLFFCAIQQAGLWALVKILGLGLVTAIVVSAWKKVIVPSGTWPALGLAVAVLWLYLVGSYHIGLDLLILAVSFLIPLLVSKEACSCMKGLFLRLIETVAFNIGTLAAGKFEPLNRRKGFIICATFLLSFWILSSLADDAWGPGQPLPREPERFQRLKAAVEQDGRWPSTRVGLALSGGGYRAVLMHAGVLDALEHLGVPVTNISTVSGGSIVGAFYATGGSPAELRDAVIEGRFRLTRTLTDAQNLSRLAFPFQVPGTQVKLFKWYDFSRTDVLANLLDKVLLGSSTIAGMKGEEDGAPELMICATDLRTGALFGFYRRGVLRKHIQHPSEKNIFWGIKDEEFATLPDNFWVLAASPRRRNAGGTSRGSAAASMPPSLPALMPVLKPDGKWLDTPLARVVAASGAFPGAFNAIHEALQVRNPGFKETEVKVLLADGGITDNSALNVMEYARQNRLEGWQELSLVLSSDASAMLSEDESLTSLGELTRAVDIVYANIGSTGWDQNLPKILLSPAGILDTRVLSSTLSDDERDVLLRAQVEKVVGRSIKKLDEQSLPLLYEAMPEGNAKRLLKNLSDNTPDYLRDHGPGTMAEPDPVRWREMEQEVVDEFVACSKVFLQTSTLTDHFENPADAARLFRLGQFIVVFNWPYIKAQLLAAASVQAAVAATRPSPGEEQSTTDAQSLPTQAASALRPRRRPRPRSAALIRPALPAAQ